MHCGKAVAALALFVVAGVSHVAGNSKIFNALREVDPPNKYPWAGWILIGSQRVKCGAVLVNSQAAMTAASCASADIVSITFGDHNRDDNEGTEQVFTVNSTYVHPEYDSATKAYDVAILTFTAPAVLNSVVAVLPFVPLGGGAVARVTQKHMRVVGWGYEVLGSSDLVRDQTSLLMEVTVDVGSGLCNNVSAPQTLSCYVPYRDQTALTCEGDVGGALQVKNMGVWSLFGIMSDWNVGNGCQPGERAATLVTSFTVWAESIINSLP